MVCFWMMKILEIFQIIDLFNMLWMISLLIIFMASFRTWKDDDDLSIFGFFVFYIVFFPLYKRWDRYFNDILTEWPSFWFSFFVLLLLIILWLILFVKLLPEILYYISKYNLVEDRRLDSKIILWLINPHINEESKIKKWLKNFSRIWSSWVGIISNLPGMIVPFEFLVKNIPKHLDTKKKILWFVSLTLFLPRMLTLFALFYDIYVENELYWFPKVGLLLTLSVLTRMCLTFIESPSRDCMHFISSKFIYEIPEKGECPKYMYEAAKKVSETAQVFNMKLKEEFKEEYDSNILFKEYILYTNILQWFDFTNALISNIFSKILLVFLTGQLGAQIKLILKHYNDF